MDTSTGQVTVIDSFVADDCGKAINPLAVHGQTHGATVQAIGWTLYENLQYEDGRLMNGNFADYTMPTADAVPMLRTDVVESNDPNGPYGAKAPAKPRSCRARRRSPMPSSTPWACASSRCRSRRRRCWLACAN